MKRMILVLILLSSYLGAGEPPDRLRVSISGSLGFDGMNLDVPPEVKYTPPHPADQPASVVGGFHDDPRLGLGTTTFGTGIELRLTDTFSIEGGISWIRFVGSSRSEESYPPYSSYTYFDTDVDEWVREPYAELTWTFYEGEVGRCSLSFGVGHTDEFAIEYKRGWYRWGNYQLAAVHSAEVGGSLYYIKYRMSSREGIGIVARLNWRKWEASFDTGQISTDRNWGLAIGIEFGF